MYLTGFGNNHATEARLGALPMQQNSPQQCAQGLYAEQLSGSAFTRARHQNLRTWLYRKLPSVTIHDFTLSTHQWHHPLAAHQLPNPMRWSPLEKPATDQHFLQGLFHLTSNHHMQGYIYQCSRSMNNAYFTDRDGELLFIPYQGTLRLRTEMGVVEIKPGMIAVIPRGIYFSVDVLEAHAAGYLCENAGSPLTLPELGLVGANGLANPRHFLYPKAAFDESETAVEIHCKYQNNIWISKNNHSPLNVVAWHGNYAPYCYDLSLFNTINTVSFDHPDPSIFTVLTSPSHTPGVPDLDFVIFPPRWMVAEHTFRPPYFHRNVMNEWMGLIQGEYDAKKEGFLPGGSSIHNCMTGHGPDVASFKQASRAELTPSRYENTLAFMLESSSPWLITQSAMHDISYQSDYTTCWQGFTAPSE